MSNPSDDQLNPYAPAQTMDQAHTGASDPATSKLIKDYRSQILALGVLWIIFGSLAIFALVAIYSGALGNGINNVPAVFGVILGGVAIGWAVSGVLAVTKNIWGVYIGLGLSYLSLVGNILQMSVCGIVILVVIIIQAHRVIGFASKMRNLGIPLSQKS